MLPLSSDLITQPSPCRSKADDCTKTISFQIASEFPVAAAAGLTLACSSLVGLNAPFTLFHVLCPRALVLGDPSDVVDCEFCAARHDDDPILDPAAASTGAVIMPSPALLDLPKFQLPLLWSTLLDLLSRLLLDWSHRRK